MNWIIAGLIAGVIAYLVDWLMWGKVFVKGMDAFMVVMSPEEMKRFMGPAMAKSAVLALQRSAAASGTLAPARCTTPCAGLGSRA